MKSFFCAVLVILLTGSSYAYDCSKHQPFVPIEYQSVDIHVGHFYWKQGPAGPEEVNEDVCASTSPLLVPVLDIRGREEEWFYCSDKNLQPELTCTSTFQGLATSIQIQPAVVVRSWGASFARDSHFHAYVLPGNDATKYFDIFARSLSKNLVKQSLMLDAAGGGRGENSGVDSFYIRADFN